MFKVVKFGDGTEAMGEIGKFGETLVKVEFFKDNTEAIEEITTDIEPKRVEGKFIIKGKKTVVDLKNKKPDNKAKDPTEATKRGNS